MELALSLGLNRPLGQGFNPSMIAGNEVWYDAADATTFLLNGSLVVEWYDKSGNSYKVHQLTASKQPAYTEQVNGLNVVTFDGTSDYLQSVGNLDIFRQPYTMFFAGSFGGTAQDMFSWISGSNSGIDFNASNLVNKARFLHRFPRGLSGGDDLTPTTPIVYDTFTIFGMTRDSGKNMEMFYDGVSVGTLAGSDNFFDSGSEYILGALTLSGTRYLDGKIGEIAIYDRLLTDTDLAQMHNYLLTRWGVS
jgi:hypothetical protein